MYGKLTTIKNTAAQTGTFTSHTSAAIRIVVTKTTSGTERQQEYANNLKIEAMMTIDKVSSVLISKGANEDKTLAWRNALLETIDGDLDAAHVINTLKDTSRHAEQIALAYNVLP